MCKLFSRFFSDTDVEKLKKLSRHHSGVEPSTRSRHSSGDPTDDDDDDDLILGVFASQEERDKWDFFLEILIDFFFWKMFF